MNLLFAWRYFRAPKSTNAINIIAWVSMTAIVVGSGALIVVLSVFNGFEDLVKSLYSTFYTDLKVLPASGKTLTLTEDQLKKIRSVGDIKAFSLVAEDKALLQNGEMQSLVIMKGVDEEYTKVAAVEQYILSGKFNLGTLDEPAMVMGAVVENVLGVRSDRDILPVTAYVFRRGSNVNLADPLQSLSSANVIAAGSFLIQQDFDNKYVLTNLPFIKAMLRWQPDEYSGVEIALTDPGSAASVQAELARLLGNNYKVLTRFEQNKSLYTVMMMEKWVIYGILVLILVVAAFNMIGALTMLVMEKQKDIQVLKAMGADDKRVQRIFLSSGLLIALMGAGLGFVLALLLCWAQVQFHLIPLQGSSFVVNYYPVSVQWTDLVLVMVTVLLVALVASWLPARKAAMQRIELKS
ncbi:MAG TPA: FtsX-like permease family protein [Chitinophagaceae bacterium]|nr:FtsX-like permease family protein [Chitinophagaceae bacterium]